MNSLIEKLDVKDGMSAWIKDFKESDAPQFKGKSDKERREMAIAAYMGAKKNNNLDEKYDKYFFVVKQEGGKTKYFTVDMKTGSKWVDNYNLAATYDNENEAARVAKQVKGQVQRGVKESVSEAKNDFTDKQIKMAYGILNDPRYKSGNLTKAVDKIEKIAKGLSKHPGVQKAMKATTESVSKDLDEKSMKSMVKLKPKNKLGAMSAAFAKGDIKAFRAAANSMGSKSNITVSKRDHENIAKRKRAALDRLQKEEAELVNEDFGTIALGVAGGLLLLKFLKFGVKKVIGSIGMNVKLPKEKLLEILEVTYERLYSQRSNKAQIMLVLKPVKDFLKSEINAGRITTVKQVVDVIEKGMKTTNESVDLSESVEKAAKEIHNALFTGAIGRGQAMKNYFNNVMKDHGVNPKDKSKVIDAVRKMGYTGKLLDEAMGVAAYDKKGNVVGLYKDMKTAKMLKPNHTYKAAPIKEKALDENKVKDRYKELKKRSVKDLRQMIGQKSRGPVDLSGYDKEGAISDLLRSEFGNKQVADAMGLKEAKIDTSRYVSSHGKNPKSGYGNWMFTSKGKGDVNMDKEGDEYIQVAGTYKDATAKAKEWAKKNNHNTVYVMESADLDQISEASLSRVWQHTQSDKPIGLITAFRGEYDRKENMRRNRELAAKLRRAGYGYFFVDGYWIENEGTEKEMHVAEDSIFVIGPDGSDQQFIQQLTKLSNEYNQDGVLIKTQEGAKIYFKDGRTQNLGKLVPGKMGSAYTKLRKSNSNATFVFESERDDLSWLQRLAESGAFNNLRKNYMFESKITNDQIHDALAKTKTAKQGIETLMKTFKVTKKGAIELMARVLDESEMYEATIKTGDNVTVKNAKKYDSLSAPTVKGKVMSIKGNKAQVKVGSGMMDVDMNDLTLSEGKGGSGKRSMFVKDQGDDHIIMQLRSAQDLGGLKKIKFRGGREGQVDKADIDTVLKVHELLSPEGKRKLRVMISKSPADLTKAAVELRKSMK